MLIRYKFTTEFLTVTLLAIALAVIDVMLYIVIGDVMLPLLIIAAVMVIVALNYSTSTKKVYLALEGEGFKVRTNGPMNPAFKMVVYSDISSAIIVGSSLTVYYNKSHSVEVDLTDMKAVDAIAFVRHLKNKRVAVDAI